jgi:hypothetical protein
MTKGGGDRDLFCFTQPEKGRFSFNNRIIFFLTYNKDEEMMKKKKSNQNIFITFILFNKIYTKQYRYTPKKEIELEEFIRPSLQCHLY